MTVEDKIKQQIKKSVEEQVYNGSGNTVLSEITPNYNNTECEKVIEGKNNTYIVLGRDRPGDKYSGYGGKGKEKSGAIDIVVGRTSALVKDFDKNSKILTDPSIAFDASRITLSQRTDVDENFYLPGKKHKEKAAISIKSDNVRVIAREAIKLVTNIDKYNSTDGDLKISKYGVELYATDGEKIQSMVKGENLSECISNLIEQISQINCEIANIYKVLLTICTALSFHTHVSSPTGGPTAPSVELGPALAATSTEISAHCISTQLIQTNLVLTKYNYLTKLSEKYINSIYHKLD